MLVVQFQMTNGAGGERDTRDIGQLREDLSKEQRRQQQLLTELREAESLLTKYEQTRENQKVTAMRNKLTELKKEAGLTKVSGQGIVLRVEPLVSGSLIDEKYHPVTPKLLRTLINELNLYGATEIAIDGERVITTTPIRSVNGQTYVNDRPISDVPFKMKVLAEDARELNNEMQVSQSRENFARADLNLTFEVKSSLELPPYDQHILIENLTLTEEDS
jgi:uncharacterized protein YlxW (UPF0749 family)